MDNTTRIKQEAELLGYGTPEYIVFLTNNSTHSRFKPWCGNGYINFYGREITSPTGVLLIGSCDASKENEDIIRRTRPAICPLSPTER
jgi:hypothetical protein